MFKIINKIDPKVNYVDYIKDFKVLIFKELFIKEKFYDETLTKILELINVEDNNIDKISFLESISEKLSGKDIINLHFSLKKNLQPFLMGTTKSIFEKLLQTDNFWINENSVIRSMTPHSCIIENPSFKEYRGKLELHNPHIDSQQFVAYNAINYWIPLTNINDENTLMFFPETINKFIPTNRGAIKKDAYLGEPLLLKCEPGDVIVFHSQLVHSPVLNTSKVTRWVITNRITNEIPNHPRNFFPLKYFKAKYLNDNNYSKFIKSYRLDFFRIKNILIIIEYYINRIIKKIIHKSFKNILLKLIEFIFNPFFKDKRFAYNFNKKNIIQKPIGYNNIIVKDDKCEIELGGKVLSFQRYCPHKGADLSLGNIHNKKLYCPWHNYCFDLNNDGKGKNGIFNLKTDNIK